MSDIFGAPCTKDIGRTILVGGRGNKVGNARTWDAYMVNGTIRRLTSTEGKRMMGFPDDFVFPVSETQAMRQLGNSVAVPAVEAVARKILEALERGR